MRLNKHLSEAGYCSRREADRLIGEGRVTVNGLRARVGAELGEGDKVAVDGQNVAQRAAGAPNKRRHVYIAYHKPVGVTCTTEADVAGNIVEAIGHEQRIFPIGRLDKDSEGLILLTSNGDIVNEILRAENSKEKEYLVGVNKDVTESFLRGMAKGGIAMHGQTTLPCKVAKIGPVGFRIVLTQGLNRQIRLMCTHFGYRVKRLFRSRIVNIQIGHLKPGQWRNLSDAELRGLLPNRTEW
ncbi:MAG TPA: 23S rRNA pseudouridine synthase F [Xanthomonadaceae bacterium]|jgi:23S rRNA pseudouridine2604 synthase|nr:23S rRNA pseudouridine synthase F [Xanthomonadaceae bacterium]